MAKKNPKKKLVSQKKINTILIFLITLNLLAIPLYAIIYYNVSFEPMQNLISSVSFSIFKTLGYDATLDGKNIYILVDDKILQIEISWDSTGWKSLYILSVLVLATPAANSNRKLMFLLFALPAIFLINLARILTTITISLNYGLQYFDLLHLFLWRAVSIVVVVGFWYVFLKREKYNIR